MGKKVTIVVDFSDLGSKGGAATAAGRTPAERKAAARSAIKARWDAYYAKHPEKLKIKQEKEARKAPRRPRKRA